MRDPFQQARLMAGRNPMPMAAGQPAMPPAATMAPLAAQPTPTQNPSSTESDFLKAAQQAGLGKMEFDKNPTIARTQLIQFLQQKYGSGYAEHPEAQQLLNSFNVQSQGSEAAKEGLPSRMASSMKSLMGVA